MRKVSILCLFFLTACGGGSSSSPEIINNNFEIFISGLDVNGFSYDQQNISVTSTDTNCSYTINSNNLIHLSENNGNNFSFRNPIIYESSREFNFVVSTIPKSDCRSSNKTVSIKVNKFPTEYDAYPANISDLSTNYYQVNDIGFGGIVITDRFSATICYPTPDDCEVWENELFGQDAS